MNQPDFREQLKRHPHNGDLRYHFAKVLEQQGRLREAQEQYELAARDGHLASLIQLKQTTLKPLSDEIQVPASNGFRLRDLLQRMLAPLLLFLVAFHLLAEPLGLDRLISLFTVANTLPGDLPRLVVENARLRFHDTLGRDPKTLQELTQAQPVNFMSALSPDLLAASGCPCQLPEPGLELRFYPEANQLALGRGEEILAVYSVATGPPLPFVRSKVSRRVVNPNGGKGAWGTRGLELQEGYAIHGTNQLEAIGRGNITKGCLRLRNVDIETLYPYVSLGTPFAVLPGSPHKPTFPEGLPPLGELLHPRDEETPGVRYQWKQ
ncbi:L,D-transpeptidase [Tumebacillus permanentifrigoris]|uniref:L,D-transpeptidase-like protein n=1 Tax=Tumebacillus permanentifrigoris TaxID=378543 RepID=A0A316DAG6_9BACL|nr:L,D-transpeptidase [Tumebacillus permanentifrigoris]PWK14495.1 L,D-transpeptidase-like protein [Tumebacillus permanentifrigoris]